MPQFADKVLTIDSPGFVSNMEVIMAKNKKRLQPGLNKF
jgi:hypothetical protein